MILQAEQSIGTSLEFSWNDLRICSEICPPPPERITYPSSSEHCIVLHIANADNLERRLDEGKWQRSPSYPGGLTFVPADQKVEWLWDAEVELFEIYLSPILLERIGRESFEINSQRIELRDRFAIRDPFLEQLALALKAELAREPQLNRFYLESLQNVLAVHLLRHHCSVELGNAYAPKKFTQSQLRQILSYIQDNLGQEIGLAQLAQVARISPHYFGKLFKQSVGMPPHQYILQYRIERAKELLAQKQLSIAAIATQLELTH